MRFNTASPLRSLPYKALFLSAYSAFLASTLVGCGSEFDAKPSEPIAANAPSELLASDARRIETEPNKRRLVDSDLTGTDEHSYIPVLEAPAGPNPQQVDSDANADRFPGEFQQRSRLPKQETAEQHSRTLQGEDHDPIDAVLVEPSLVEKRRPALQWTGRLPSTASTAPPVARPTGPRR